MRWLFDIENPVMRYIIKIFDCMCLSILWMVCCLPVVTAGAATAALYATVYRYLRKEEGHLLGTYFGAFRENWKRSTPVWLVLLAAGALLVDRSSGKVKFDDIPMFSLMEMTPETWTAEDCPMCKAGGKPVHPGS